MQLVGVKADFTITEAFLPAPKAIPYRSTITK